MARVADRKRGWGKFCSKSCKATKQTRHQVARRKAGEIVHKKAYLEAKAYNNPDALTSSDLRVLGASRWEIHQTECEEALYDAFPLGDNF